MKDTEQGYTPPSAIVHPKKRAFLAAYAEIGTITHAAAAAGIHRNTVSEWANSDPAFADAFEDAKTAFAESLELEAFRRARQGVRELVLHHGKAVRDPRTGEYMERITYSDRLLELTLRAKLPDQYRDRTSTELSGPDGAPLSVHSRVAGMSEEDLDSLLAELDQDTGTE